MLVFTQRGVEKYRDDWDGNQERLEAWEPDN